MKISEYYDVFLGCQFRLVWLVEAIVSVPSIFCKPGKVSDMSAEIGKCLRWADLQHAVKVDDFSPRSLKGQLVRNRDYVLQDLLDPV